MKKLIGIFFVLGLSSAASAQTIGPPATGGVPVNLTLTPPASPATFTLLGGKIVTFNNTLAFSGTDSTTMTFPSTSASVARIDASQTFIGNQIFANGIQPSGITGGSLTSNSNGLYNTSSSGRIVASSGGKFAFSSGTAGSQAEDTFFVRAAAATWQIGDVNAASPVNQTIQAQGSRSGTDSNVGGANLTISSGQGTGTGTTSSLILQSPVAVGSGSGAQTMTTGLTIRNGQAVMPGYTVSTLPTGITGGRAYVTDATACTFLTAVTGGASTFCPVIFNGSAWVAD